MKSLLSYITERGSHSRSPFGIGQNSTVEDIGGGKVKKTYNLDHIKYCDLPFVKYCFKHKSKVFPIVYEYGDNWVILEKLKLNTPEIKKWFKYLDDIKYEGKSIYEWTKEKNVDEKIFDEYGLKVYHWCKQCQKEMKEMNSPYISWPGDLVINNVGQRKNGDIVFFDI